MARILPPTGGWRFLAIAGGSNIGGSHSDAAPSAALGRYIRRTHNGSAGTPAVTGYGPDLGLVMDLAGPTTGLALALRTESGSSLVDWTATYLAQLVSAAADYRTDPVALLWGHGGVEAKTEALADSYDTDCGVLFTTLRTSWPSVVIYIADWDTTDTATYPYISNLRTSRAALAGAHANNKLLDCTSAEQRADNYHWSGQGCEDVADLWIAALTSDGLL